MERNGLKLRAGWYRFVQVAYDLALKMNPRKLAAHAVITDDQGRVLILKSRYAGVWSFPGGGIGRRENLDVAVARECREELGVELFLDRLAGFYYLSASSTYTAIFRGRTKEAAIKLSHEHSQYLWSEVEELPQRLRIMAADALNEPGPVAFRTME